MKKLFTWLRLRWRHRSHVPLYPDVWRRPDGVCVNDAGRVWDEFWQQPEGPEKNRSRIGWAAFVAVVWGLALGVNPARADFPTQVFFYATTNFNGMSGEAEACWLSMMTTRPPAWLSLVCSPGHQWLVASLFANWPLRGAVKSHAGCAWGPAGWRLSDGAACGQLAGLDGRHHQPQSTAPLLYPVYAKVKQPDGSYKIKIVKVIAK